MKKLHLGCGKVIKKGYINLDYIKLPGVDVVQDLNKFPWPFKDNSFDVIYCSHILEHVDNLVEVMKEIHRISKRRGRVKIRGPHFSCGVSYIDPTHKRFFSYFTFDFFCKTDKVYTRDVEGLFKIVKKKLNFTRLAFPSLNYIFNPIINFNPAIYERFFCWMLPCSESMFELEAIK